jgi:hypothetical protein
MPRGRVYTEEVAKQRIKESKLKWLHNHIKDEKVHDEYLKYIKSKTEGHCDVCNRTYANLKEHQTSKKHLKRVASIEELETN